MKKVLKLFSLLLVVVLLMSLLVGCSLFGRNTAKYRNLEAMTVGDESITIGKILDYYISNYYNNITNIQYGYITIDDLFTMTVADLVSKYGKLDSYKKGGNPTYTVQQNSFVGTLENAEYLNQAEANFIVSYIKFSLFSSIDSYLEGYVTAEIGDLGTITEDTSRDFLKFDDWTHATAAGATTYAEYVYYQSLTSEEAEEYFEEFYSIDYKNDVMSLDASDYVNDATHAQVRAEKLNERLKKYVDDQDDDEEKVYPTITAEQVIEFQQRALKKYEKNVKSNYDIPLNEYVVGQIEDAIISVIGQKFDLNANLLVETDVDFLSNLQTRFSNRVAAATIDYGAKSDAFKDFVESLSDSSYIFNIPTDYVGKYVYVKNLLIPFDDYQKALLSNYAVIVGTNSDAYKQKALEVAAGISARDFNVEDEEADDAYINGIFTLDSNNDLVLNANVLSDLFVAGAKSGIFGGTDQDFMDLMKRFNTDIGQHSTRYDYVVRIGDTPDSFSHPWVTEFVDAANQAYNLSVLGNKGYSICVSTYGVHIVYYSGDVTAWDTYDTSKIYQPDSFEYSFMVNYYSSVQSTFTKEIYDQLEDTYRYGGKITINKEFEKMLDEYGFSFDFEGFTTKD